MVSIQHWRGDTHTVGPGELEDGPTAEATLLRAGQAGDRAALEQLVALHERPLFALCHGILGHVEDAEDAVQETFLRALRGLPRFRGESTFRTWLYRIAVNVCLERKASHRATMPWDEEHPPTLPDATSPEAMALRQLRVVEALRSLPPRQRAILLLKEREGWSVAEIAAALGWNKKRVENELYKARCALDDWRRREAGEGEEP
jgi:RNA polymerase sigma-70 factor, ECF subfamily